MKDNIDNEKDDLTSFEHNHEKVNKVRDMVKVNRAAALGVAVLFATSTFLTGCSLKKPKDPNQEEEETTYIGGSGYHSYYHYYGSSFSGSGNTSLWGKSAGSFNKGGYSSFRGGSSGA